jgi:DNA-directed RNA polymerase specialized sigma24 family protein
VQSFFLSCLEKDWLAAADRAKGRFRSFLLVAFKRFVAKELAKSRTRKRGGDHAFIELDALSAEKRYTCEPTGLASADRLYERRWALTLLEQVLERLEQEQTRAGNERTFTALKEFLSGNGRGTAYAELAGPLGLSEGAVKVAVHRLRRRYREMLEAEIANTVSSPDEIEEERRFLLNALS